MRRSSRGALIPLMIEQLLRGACRINSLAGGTNTSCRARAMVGRRVPAQESKLVPEEEDECWDVPNLDCRFPIGRIRGAQGVDGISNTVHPWGPTVLSTAAA